MVQQIYNNKTYDKAEWRTRERRLFKNLQHKWNYDIIGFSSVYIVVVVVVVVAVQ